MKILILGGNGMLGHQFLQAWHEKHDVKVTLRGDISDYANANMFTSRNSFSHVDAMDLATLNSKMEAFAPDAVVNAIGVTKQRTDGSNIIPTLTINALFPHQLAALCLQHQARLIHLSTDCVFSGKMGFYNEGAISDAEDLYGRSKFLGEVNQAHVVTLRKSTIGLELAGSHGLIEWFLAQKGVIRGYRKAIYSGLVSSELARVVENILLGQPQLSGVWHVSSEPINKYDLLLQLAERLGRKDVVIEPDDMFMCDRSLNGNAFQQQTGYIAPSWTTMLDELARQIEERIL